MSGIIYDARRVKAYEGLLALGEYAGKDPEWLDGLWEKLVPDEGLMKEFMYYLDHHTFCDEDKCCGYGLTDLYVWQMDRYNLIRDIGKNTECCNKEAMVLNALFYCLTDAGRGNSNYQRSDKSDDKTGIYREAALCPERKSAWKYCLGKYPVL